MSDTANAALQITGGCLCGASRYAAEGSARFAVNCHCRVCQRITGSGYTPVMAFDQADVALEGELRWFERTGDAGRKVWESFCATCGARLAGKAETMPGLLLLQAGSFDEPALFRPMMNLYTASAAPWDALDPRLPDSPGMPPL
jgi:hypothetical protein